MEPRSPLQDLIALAHEPSSGRRRELLRRVTDLFFGAGPGLSPAEAGAFDGVFCTLAQDMEMDIRAELAERFAGSLIAPASLAAQLARDCIEVALPVLSNPNLLSEADLLVVARTQGQPHLRVVSARPGLTEAVSDVIVERGDDETLGVLVRNDLATLSRRASETVVERAAANPDLQAAVVERRRLPLDLLNEMYFVVEGRLREHILARNASADPAAVEAALGAARTRLATPVDAEPADLIEARAEIDKLASRRRLNAPTLLGFLRSNQRTHFTVGLARLAEVEPATVRTVVDRGDLDALAVVCKAADLDKSMFLTFAVLTCGRDAMGRARTYGKLYAELTHDTALRTLRFWRIRCDGGVARTVPCPRRGRETCGPTPQPCPSPAPAPTARSGPGCAGRGR